MLSETQSTLQLKEKIMQRANTHIQINIIKQNTIIKCSSVDATGLNVHGSCGLTVYIATHRFTFRKMTRHSYTD